MALCLVAACAQAGTDYVDLCGEPVWLAAMIPLLDAPARASGARIVFSCGFDSIPFDLGVVFLQDEDRRTLMSVIIIPTVAMPLMFFGVGKIMSGIVKKTQDEIPPIAIMGGADSPGVVAAPAVARA